MVELGDLVKDNISGFTGIAAARHTFLQGCNRITIQPLVGKDKKLPESSAFDEPQLTVLKPKKAPRKEGKRGGPMPYYDTQKVV